MCDTRYWEKGFMREFIELYKSCTCLWKIKSKYYTNKKKKAEAYAKLLQFCKEFHPEYDQQVIIKKIQSLRGSFRKELRKVEEAEKAGDVYKPSLWYFDLLMFTKNQDESVTEATNEAPIGKFETYFAKEDTQDTNSTLEDTDVEDDYGTMIIPPKKRKCFEVTMPKKVQIENKNVEKVINVSEMEQIELEAVGVNVSKKLQRMEGTQAIFAESIINKVLSNGLLNKLTDNSDICDGQCKYQYSRRPSSDMSAFSDDLSVSIQNHRNMS